MSKAVDKEIKELLSVLAKIQEAVGGKKDKKKGGKDGGSADKFIEKKTEMISTIKTVTELIASKENKTPGEALRPQEIIAVDAQIREHLRNLNGDQLELERLFNKEKKKKKSKWSPEELEARGGMVTAMHSQLQELKETSLKGYVRNYQQNRAVAMVAMQDSEAFRGQIGSMPANTSMTAEQSIQLQQLKDRDKDMDQEYLTQIDQGVGQLHQMALQMHDAVVVTGQMADNLKEKIDEAADKLDRLNGKLKNTLKEVGRGTDKICVDIMCILILLGMIGVIYNMTKNNLKK